MDDILTAMEHLNNLYLSSADLQQSLQAHGLIIAQKKVQAKDPYSYLGLSLSDNQIKTLKSTI